MTVETATYIHQLDKTQPVYNADLNEGDDHIRRVKETIVQTFTGIAGEVTVTHTELNSVISRALRAGDTYTGTHDFTGATTNVATATAGAADTKAASTAFVANAVASVSVVTFLATTTATSKTLAAFEHCVVTAGGQTITLPASPVAGSTMCRIGTRAGIATTVGRNGNRLGHYWKYIR